MVVVTAVKVVFTKVVVLKVLVVVALVDTRVQAVQVVTTHLLLALRVLEAAAAAETLPMAQVAEQVCLVKAQMALLAAVVVVAALLAVLEAGVMAVCLAAEQQAIARERPVQAALARCVL